MALIGEFFSSFYSVLQEVYFEKTNSSCETQYTIAKNEFIMLLYSSIYQIIFMIIFFWVDIIPIFGYSSSFDDFYSNLKNSFYCFLGYNGCGYQNALFGTSFILGYVITNISMAIICTSSANLAIYSSIVSVPISASVFIITKVGTESTPLWSAIPAVVLEVISLVIWKRWESSEDIKHRNMPIWEKCEDFKQRNKQVDIRHIKHATVVPIGKDENIID